MSASNLPPAEGCERCTPLEEDQHQVRIVSGGNYINTRILVDGKEVGGVTDVSWHLTTGGFATAVVRIENVAVDVQGEGRVHRTVYA